MYYLHSIGFFQPVYARMVIYGQSSIIFHTYDTANRMRKGLVFYLHRVLNEGLKDMGVGARPCIYFSKLL